MRTHVVALLAVIAIGCGSASESGGAADAFVPCPDGCEPGSVCLENQCVPETCQDLMHNGEETDTDCGGECPGCSEGQSCGVPFDCRSRFCDGDVCRDCVGDDDCSALPGTSCVNGSCLSAELCDDGVDNDLDTRIDEGCTPIEY